MYSKQGPAKTKALKKTPYMGFHVSLRKGRAEKTGFRGGLKFPKYTAHIHQRLLIICMVSDIPTWSMTFRLKESGLWGSEPFGFTSSSHALLASGSCSCIFLCLLPPTEEHVQRGLGLGVA